MHAIKKHYFQDGANLEAIYGQKKGQRRYKHLDPLSQFLAANTRNDVLIAPKDRPQSVIEPTVDYSMNERALLRSEMTSTRQVVMSGGGPLKSLRSSATNATADIPTELAASAENTYRG